MTTGVPLTHGFSTLDHAAWSIRKGVHAVRSGQIYILAPAALAAYTAYKSLTHFKTALIGTDSLEFRKKVFTDSPKDISTLSKISQFCLGSISWEGRMTECKYGLGYLALSTVILYGLHAYTQKESEIQFPGDPKMDATQREFFPDRHQFYVNEQALEFYEQNEDFMKNTLTTPSDPQSEDVAVKVANSIFKPAPSSARQFVSKAWSKACSYLPYVGNSAVCDTSGVTTIDEMSLEDLEEAYIKARTILETEAPTDYHGKSASVIESSCNWVYSWFLSPELTEKRCSALENFVHPEDTDKAAIAVERLDRFYEILKTRLSTPGASVIGKIIRIGQETVSESHPVTDILLSFKKLGNFLPSDSSEIKKEYVPYYRRAAATLFGLQDSFTKSEFRAAYRELSTQIHPDKFGGSDEAATDAQGILNGLSKIFRGSNMYGDFDMSHLAEQKHITSPLQVIQDIWESMYTWYHHTQIPIK